MSSSSDEVIPTSVPSPGDPDRKRVLNVLAQRRYRQRRRERIKALEQQAKAQPPSRDRLSPQTQISTSPKENIRSSPSSSEGGVSLNANFDSLPNHSGQNHLPETEFPPFDPLLDISTLPYTVPQDLLPDNPYPDSYPGITDWDLELQPDDLFSSTFLFPLGADRNLEVPILAALKAGIRIAKTLDCIDKMWDPFSKRILTAASLPGCFELLPPNMLPTPVQQTIPHHPVLDCIPWPDVRTKLICAFSMPVHLRPPVARGETPHVDLIQHIDDYHEPIRITGVNDTDENAWEIGQPFYQNWWWAFDKKTVDHSNRLREARGAPRLRLLPPEEAES